MATGYLEDFANGEETGEARMIKALLEGANVDVPKPKEDYECEMGTGEDHKILHWEVLVQCLFGIDVDGYASGLDLEYEVMWVVRSCGHWTELY